MHLLAAPAGGYQSDEVIVDFNQQPADLLILSASDTELVLLSSAQSSLYQTYTARASDSASPLPSLVLANLNNLLHPGSVDAYIDRVAQHCRGIVAVLLGGYSYWSYLVDQLAERCGHLGLMLMDPAESSGSGHDPRLLELGNVEDRDRVRIRAYLQEGGMDNACAALAFLNRLWFHHDAPLPAPPKPLPQISVWEPNQGLMDYAHWEKMHSSRQYVVAVLFYRVHVQSHTTRFMHTLLETLKKHHLCPLAIALDSLKQPQTRLCVERWLKESKTDAVINLTAFHASTLDHDAVVLQALISAQPESLWRENIAGLVPRDLVMYVTMPEIDGRIITRPLVCKQPLRYCEHTQIQLNDYQPLAERNEWIARLASNWARLRHTDCGAQKVALILANYPTRDGRLGNGVGLDTPASVIAILNRLNEQGYKIDHAPHDADELMLRLRSGTTNDSGKPPARHQAIKLALNDYLALLKTYPTELVEAVHARWGPPQQDPHFHDGAFFIAGLELGHVFVGLQPARGYHIDVYRSYHDPALIPPHAYLAFYLWLQRVWGCDALVDVGKHGNLEWLPGKSVALSQHCWPDMLAGTVPHLYPFIVNDPGEGVQAKRRSHAVIIDHLMPALTRAQSYGTLSELENEMDEYYQALSMDRRRADVLKQSLLKRIRDCGLDREISQHHSEDDTLQSVDTYLCEIKESQIRDGLHILGQSPSQQQRLDTLLALSRLPSQHGSQSQQSMLQALCEDLQLGDDYDPLQLHLHAAKPWLGPKPQRLQDCSAAPWRSFGDTRERLECLALQMLQHPEHAHDLPATQRLLSYLLGTVAERLDASGPNEMNALVSGLQGKFIAPGPAGAPSRGRIDVLPTGRNFYSVDLRTLPTPTAWSLGFRAADELITRYRQDHGEAPTSVGLSVWGTSTIRTGGDDIAQALALLGVKPQWARESGRVIGIEILPVSLLGRPRVDVTLRISGFFRDSFPNLIHLFDRAVRSVMELEEEAQHNPLAARYQADCEQGLAQGLSPEQASKQAQWRVFGSMPGAYGAGLQALIDEKTWQQRGDLAQAYIAWSSYAYGADDHGTSSAESFKHRLGLLQAVLHNQDNREHDVLDSDDYYQFQGGMAAAVESLSGHMPALYHGDHSNPHVPHIRSLHEEISRVIRARVVNPKWIAGVMRHGYKGVFEMAATVDYLFAFDATCGVVEDYQYELVCNAYVFNTEVQDFARSHNPDALYEMTERMLESIARGQWQANESMRQQLEDLLLDLENSREQLGEP